MRFSLPEKEFLFGAVFLNVVGWGNRSRTHRFGRLRHREVNPLPLGGQEQIGESIRLTEVRSSQTSLLPA